MVAAAKPPLIFFLALPASERLFKVTQRLLENHTAHDTLFDNIALSLTRALHR